MNQIEKSEAQIRAQLIALHRITSLPQDRITAQIDGALLALNWVLGRAAAPAKLLALEVSISRLPRNPNQCPKCLTGTRTGVGYYCPRCTQNIKNKGA
mgnify:FL=1